jgi:hypothetical protein
MISHTTIWLERNNNEQRVDKMRAACSLYQITDFSKFISFCAPTPPPRPPKKHPLTMVAFQEITFHKDKRISFSHLKLLKLNVFAHNLGACFRTAMSSSVKPIA